jgi:hypothetical protein
MLWAPQIEINPLVSMRVWKLHIRFTSNSVPRALDTWVAPWFRGASSHEAAVCLVSKVANYSRFRQNSLTLGPIFLQYAPPFALGESGSDNVNTVNVESPGRCVQPATGYDPPVEVPPSQFTVCQGHPSAEISSALVPSLHNEHPMPHAWA